MKSFDALKDMPDTERLAYLHEEAEKLIQNAAPHNQLKMRALQTQCDGIRRQYKHAPLACGKMVELMRAKLDELAEAWRRL